MIDLLELLKQNSYPGRGIVIGRLNERTMRVFYFIMGRSENSRNRIFSYTEDGIRTQAFDPAKLTDPSLVIYHPVRVHKHSLIVTNGDQTDTVRDFLAKGRSFREALRTRCFEPDGPNFTPRISGIVRQGGSFDLSILKTCEGDPDCVRRYFYEYSDVKPGTGYFISTYEGDGSPLPSFSGEPRYVALPEAEELWEALNADNKVSLYSCAVDIRTFDCEEQIFNKHQSTEV